MKWLAAVFVVFILLTCPGCSKLFHACIRNLSNDPAIVDVYLLNTENMKTLPNKIRMSNRIINLKKSYAGQLDSTQNVTWITPQHFQLTVYPKTTADFSDMVGVFINGNPRGDARMIVNFNGKKDTLLNGWYNFKREKFDYTGNLFSSKLSYDISADTLQ